MGAVLDIFSDRCVESALVVGFYWLDPIGRGLPAIAMLVSILLCITSFLVVGIFSENESQKSFHYSPGLMERTEAFIFFALMMFLPQWFHLLAWVFAGLVLYTGVRRIIEFSRVLSQ